MATPERIATTSASAERVGVGMDANLRTGVLPLHPCKPGLRKLRVVALALGCSEASADKKLYGEHSLARELATTLGALIRAGYTDDAEMLCTIVDAPMLGRAVPPLPQAHREHAIADEREDLHRAECGADLSDDALDVRIKLLAAEVVRGEMLLAALRTERDARKEARR